MLRSPWLVVGLAVVLAALVGFIALGWNAQPRDSHTYTFAVVEQTDWPVIAVDHQVRTDAPDLVQALERAVDEGESRARSYDLRRQLYETVGNTNPQNTLHVAFEIDGHLVEIVSVRVAN